VGADLSELEQEISHNPRDIKTPTYGMKRWKDLFSLRQAQALATFSELTATVAETIRSDISKNAQYLTTLNSEEYVRAICTYLSFAVDKGANYWSSVCTWNANREAIVSTFGRQAIAMAWDFSEANPFSHSTGNFLSGVGSCAKSLTAAPACGLGKVIQLDARLGSTAFQDCVVETDPPYFDNIAYAELSDFFYVWLRQSLKGLWPELFRRVSTPKDDEIVAAPFRHGGKDAAETYFMEGVDRAFQSVRTLSSPRELTTIFYAFKQSGSDEEGSFSAGWATFLQGIVDAGFIVDGTWPIRTEYTGNLKRSLNVLATSVVLVCRCRTSDAQITGRVDFLRELKRELPDAIDAIRRAGVSPVDMQQAVIGPGMGIFTRYAKVLEDDDSGMTVKTALSLINRVWEEIENELDTIFDPETQVALAWFASYGFDTRGSGELIGLANAKNIPLGALFSSGVFADLHGKAVLTSRANLPAKWSPAADATVTIWECVQHTARVLNAPDGGGEAAARLVAQMGPKSSDARALAYRLYEICSQKGWAAEALVYNELAQEWARLEDIAINIATPASTTTRAQGAFTFDEGAA
jgi:putative DNA methylase